MLPNPLNMHHASNKAGNYATEAYSAEQPQVKVLAHASVVVYYKDMAIYVDPHTSYADYTHFRPADLILITHDHFDHFDQKALKELAVTRTIVIANITVKKMLLSLRPDLKVRMLKNDESVNFGPDIVIRAVPAYNIKNIRPETGRPYHSKGVGNGYIIEFPDTRIYIAGDTEQIPEMADLGEIDIAVLPKMYPFTMDGEMFIEAARLIKPKILYTYHYDTVDKTLLRQQLPGIEVR